MASPSIPQRRTVEQAVEPFIRSHGRACPGHDGGEAIRSHWNALLAARASLRRAYHKIACNPLCSVIDNRLQRSRLREEMARTRNDLQRRRAFQAGQRPLVEFDHAIINATHDQESRRANLIQRLLRKIGTPAARDDGADATSQPGGRDERSRRAGTRAEQSERWPVCLKFSIEPAYGVNKSRRQQGDVKYIRPIAFLFQSQEIEQQSAKSPGIQSLGDRNIARAETAGTAAMRERNDGARVARISQCPGQPYRRNAHIANLDCGLGFVVTGSAACDYVHLGPRSGLFRLACTGPVLRMNANQSRLVPAARLRFDRDLRNPRSKLRSEIHLVCHRNVIVEQMLVVLGANFLCHGALNSIVALYHRPRRVESIRVLERNVHLHRLAAVDQLKALDDVQLVGMWRAEIIYKSLVV